MRSSPVSRPYSKQTRAPKDLLRVDLCSVLPGQTPPKCCQNCGIVNFTGCWKEEKGQCDLVKPEDRYRVVSKESKLEA
jgi:hypothetical protein